MTAVALLSRARACSSLQDDGWGGGRLVRLRRTICDGFAEGLARLLKSEERAARLGLLLGPLSQDHFFTTPRSIKRLRNPVLVPYSGPVSH